MQGNPQTINRIYLMLDISENPCIIGYKWSSTTMVWIVEKVIWNEYTSTNLKSALEDNKYYLGVF